MTVPLSEGDGIPLGGDVVGRERIFSSRMQPTTRGISASVGAVGLRKVKREYLGSFEMPVLSERISRSVSSGAQISISKRTRGPHDRITYALMIAYLP